MSATLNDYLVLLESLRDDLASNLRKRGVEALDTETLQILVPKVLQIPQGNPYLGYFEGTLAKTHITNGDANYGVFLYGETVPFTDVFRITGYFKMASAVITLTGTGITAMTINAPDGWVVNKISDESATLTLNTEEIQSAPWMMEFLNGITFSSESEAHVSASFKAIEVDTGTEYPIEGSCSWDIQLNSWEHVEDTYPTMADLDVHTWDQVEHLET